MSDLDELKNLLFGAEKQALDTIAARVESRDVRAADVSDILPEAIHRSHRKNGELVESLTEPVGECLQKAFRDDPETYGNALYPVMGPAIRKSIMHALRGFAQQINEAVEHSISPKGLKWRLQASRAGVPFGEYVMQRTLLYRVEQAYLISRENGLLMSHVHHEASKIKDSDAVSAMFTAIQDFVKESFSPDRTGRLESADMGEFTLWAVHGPHALLVCVIRGIPPRSLRADLSAILERIHFRYGDAIREYKGDTASVADVEDELERCLRFQERQEAGAKKRRGPPVILWVVLLLLAAGAIYLAASNWIASKKLAAFEAALADSPGLYLSEVSRDGNEFFITGLRDPLAPAIVDIAARAEIPAEKLSVEMQAFQSLDPEIVRLRAERALEKPPTVQFAIDEATLRVTGTAQSSWQQALKRNFRSVAGIETLDVSALTSSDLAPAVSFEQLQRILAELGGARFYFSDGVTFRDGERAKLDAYSVRLAALAGQAKEAGVSLLVNVLGSTDSSGDESVNARVAKNRAQEAAAILEASGIEVSNIGRASNTSGADGSQIAPDERHVRIDLSL